MPSTSGRARLVIEFRRSWGGYLEAWALGNGDKPVKRLMRRSDGISVDAARSILAARFRAKLVEIEWRES